MNRIVKQALLLVVLSTVASMAAFGADFVGVWKSPKPAQTLTIKEEGGKISGTLQGTLGTLRIAEGKIDGDNVTLTFFVVLSNGRDPLGLAGYDAMAEEGQVTELTYTGKLTGDDLKVKVKQERLDETREFSFHKSN